MPELSDIAAGSCPASPGGTRGPSRTLHRLAALAVATVAATLVACTGTGVVFTEPPQSQRPGVYVDALNGHDDAAGDADAPYKTLARALHGMPPGTMGRRSLYLRCGRTWREPLHLTPATARGGSLLVAGYGPGCAASPATVSGADDLSGGWVLQDGVWSRRLPPGMPKINQLFIDGVSHHVAQWPNADAPSHRQSARLRTLAAGSKQMLDLPVDAADSLRSRDLEGATAQVRSLPWLVETSATLGFDTQQPNRLKLARPLRFEAVAGAGVVLQDKRWMLDVAGEFWHDTVAGVLHVMPLPAQQQGDINQRLVEGSVRDTPINVQDLRGVQLRDIRAEHGRRDGIAVINSPSALLQRVQSIAHGGAGIFLAQWTPLDTATPGPQVRDSLVDGNAERGIDAAQVRAVQLVGNRITRTGTGYHVGPSLSAVLAGPAALVQDNVVDGAAYNGIAFSGSGGSRVAGNRISNYCLRLSDCAGIYAWNGPAGALPALGQHSLVEGNTVLAATLPTDGTVGGTGGGGSDVLAGVYLDDFMRGVTVRDNTLHGMPMGIFLHNASGNTVERNRVWLPTRVGLWVSTDQALPAPVDANVVRDNETVLAETAAGDWAELPGVQAVQAVPAVWLWRLVGDSVPVPAQRFSGNRVRTLTGPSSSHAVLVQGATHTALDARQWLALQPDDGAVADLRLFAPYTLQLGPEQVPDADFGAGLALWQGWFGQGSPGRAEVLRGDPACNPCVRFASGGAGDMLFSGSFRLAPGRPYLYRYAAAFVQPGQLGAPHISRAGPPWDSVADARGFTGLGPATAAAGSTLAQNAFFHARGDFPVQVNLHLQRAGMAALFSEASVREVLAHAPVASADMAAVVAADPDRPRTVGCADMGWPAGCTAMTPAGEPIPLPAALPAGAVRLFLRAGAQGRR